MEKKTFKKHEFVSRNKMKFESGYATFDRQVDYITNGNALSNVQVSGLIRAASEAETPEDRGKLRRFDLKAFGALPAPVSGWLDSHRDDRCWLYRFRFRDDTTLGWILTDRDMTRSEVKVICPGCNDNARTLNKKAMALLEAEKYVVKGRWE